MYFQIKTSEGNLKDSWDLLLRIVLEICESDLVSAIGSFWFKMNNIRLHAPEVCGYDAITDMAKNHEFKLMDGLTAIENKLAGLYIEKEEVVNKRKKDYTKETGSEKFEGLYLLDSGLNGVRTCIRYLSRRGGKDLPSFLKSTRLESFEFYIPVIWEMNKHGMMYEDGVFWGINSDRDYIRGRCGFKECSFSLRSFTEDHLESYNDDGFINHLNGIQRILKDVAPGKFDIHSQIENLDQQLNLIELGILNRNEQGYYPIDDGTFKKALNRLERETLKRSQEEMRMTMQRIDEDVAEYKEKGAKGNIRAGEAGVRLQMLRSVIKAILRCTYDEEEARESENEEKSN